GGRGGSPRRRRPERLPHTSAGAHRPRSSLPDLLRLRGSDGMPPGGRPGPFHRRPQSPTSPEQVGLYRAQGEPHRLRDLLVAHLLLMAEDDDHAVFRRQLTKGQLQPLPVPGHHGPVLRIALERRGLQVLPFPVQRHRCGTAAGRPDAVEAGVGRHLAEPGSDGPPPLEVADRLQNPHEHLLGGVEGVLPVAKEGVGTPVDAHLIPVEQEGEPLRPPLLAQAYDLVVRVHGLLPRSRRSGAGGLELWTRIPSPRCSAPAMHSAKPPLRSRGRPARGSAWPFTWYYTPRQEKFQGEEEMWDPAPEATGSSQPPQPAGKRGRARGPGPPAGGPRAGHRAT